METKRNTPAHAPEWQAAKGLFPGGGCVEKGLHGALIPAAKQENDHIAVVYDKGETPPKITIQEVSGTVHTVLANGVAIAVVARATGPAPSVNDVLLVERST